MRSRRTVFVASKGQSSVVVHDLLPRIEVGCAIAIACGSLQDRQPASGAQVDIYIPRNRK